VTSGCGRLHRVEPTAVAVVCAVAVGTLGYRLGAGTPITVAASAALAVLLAAASPALRLATTTPLLVATGRAAQLGILLGNPRALVVAHRIDTVVLAGTGTLATCAPVVHDVHVADGVDPEEVLRLAGAVAQESDRPHERAVAARAGPVPDVAEFDTVDDLGLRGVVAEIVPGADGDERVVAHAVLVGGVDLLAAHDIALPTELATVPAGAALIDRTAVAVAWDGVARAVLVVGPGIAPSDVTAVQALRELGVRPVLLTSGTADTAHAVARPLGIAADAVFAEIAPAAEADVVRRLRRSGGMAVIGDGAHPAALGAADLAVAATPGAGGDLTLMRADLPAAVDAIRIARRAALVTRTNLVWALTCIALVLPAAATGLAGPAVAGAATAAGAAAVVVNSLRLQRFSTRLSSAPTSRP
jgi:cation transport ATPase